MEMQPNTDMPPSTGQQFQTPWPKTIKKNTNSTPNKSQTQRVLEHTKLRNIWAQIVSWAPIHARDFFIVLAPDLTTEITKTLTTFNCTRCRSIIVVTSDHLTNVGFFSFLYNWNYVKMPFLAFPHLFSFLFWIFSSSSDIMLTFQKDCIFVTFLVILLIVHVSHPYKT